MQPEFYGSSVKFAQAFKQARRLQSLVRAIRSSSLRQQHHLPSLWYRIRHALGFNGSFVSGVKLKVSSILRCRCPFHLWFHQLK